MKKLLFVFAFGALAVTACNKEVEQEQATPTPIAQTITLSASGEAFGEIDLNGASTKATLDAAGNFLWADGDQIGVRLYKGSNYLGTWTYYSDSYTAWDATFALDSGYDGQSYGKLTCTTVITDEYVNWGYAAFYPKFNNNISSSDGKVYFELKKVYENYTSGTCLMPMVACLGNGGDGLRPTDISLKHVGAGVRVTLKDVPANANQASLTVAGKNIANGDNYTPWFGVNPANAGADAIAATNGDEENTVYLQFATASEPRDITFIFPLPTVDLSGGITIKLYYGSEYTEFWSKTSHPVAPKTPLPTLGRGDLLDMPELTVGDWVKLGTGEYIDNFLFGKIAGADGNSYSDKIDIDIPDYVPVVVEQNISDPSQYRLVEPYKTARDQFGYTPRVETTPDKYLYFTISSSDGTVSFNNGTADTPYVTGMVVDSGNKIIRLAKKAGRTSDKLLDGTYDNPKVIQLDPLYQYSDGSNLYHNDKERGNMIHFIFPRAKDDYKPVITLGNDPRTVVSSFNLTTVSPRVHLLLSQNNAVYNGCNWTYHNGGTFGTYTSNQTGLNWSGYISTSGTWYLTWHVYTSDTIEVLRQGCIKFQALSESDAANVDLIAGTYLRDINVGTASADAVEKELNLMGGNSLTIEQSDDLSKGNIMITGFAGYNYNLVGSALSTEGKTAGKPLYGSFNGSAATFPYRSLTSAEAFYTDGSTAHYISAATVNLDDITLNYDSTNKKIVTDGRWLADSGGSTVGTYRIYWQDYYTAYKITEKVALTGAMITASSTAGSDDTSHLVDQNQSTIWHAAYSGTHDLDETYGIYLDIDLGTGNTVTNFTIMFQNRNSYTYNYPNKYKVYGYNSSTGAWDLLTGADPVIAVGGNKGIYDRSGLWSQCRVTDNDTAYQKIRLSIVETQDSSGASSTLVTSAENNHGTTHLAELQLWKN